MNVFDISKLVRGIPVTQPVGIVQPPKLEGIEAVEYDLPDPVEYTQFGTPQVAPLKMKLSSQTVNDWWLFPVEPLISIDGENVLIRRNVSKMPQGMTRRRGTIKERWAQGDYSITIEGLFTDNSTDAKFPDGARMMLLAFCEAREPIDVQCPLFTNLGITRIAIEKWNLPFTKGTENQSYRINAFSDDDWDLLIKLKR